MGSPACWAIEFADRCAILHFDRQQAGDIALLALNFSHTDLWRYECELASLQISVASQAGKALIRRQETQDVLALLPTLSDPTDRLALARCSGDRSWVSPTMRSPTLRPGLVVRATTRRASGC